MYTYPQSDRALPHSKCVLRCCADCPYINIPDQETNLKYEETTPSIRFHVYHIISRCTSHGRIRFKIDINSTTPSRQRHSVFHFFVL